MKEIIYNKETDAFEVHLTIPRTQRGSYTYDDDVTWEQDAVCVCINDRMMDYSLNYMHYLDYKDALQATRPIIFFDSKEEAEAFAKNHKLMIEYSR